MLKVTIQEPNGAIITLEASEAEIARSIIEYLRERLSGDPQPVHSERPTLDNTNGSKQSTPTGQPISEVLIPKISADPCYLPATPEFLKFCQRLTPIGDMRRVVVIAEAARRYLGLPKVSSSELEILFDTIEWPKPKDFTLTVRNAGRSKFRWLERVPGDSGYYVVTDRGRDEILGQGR